MLSVKYSGLFEGGFRTGFFVNPNELQQGGSCIIGILIDWDQPPDSDLQLEFAVKFANNQNWSGILNPNTFIQSGDGQLIDGIMIGLKKNSFWSFLPMPQFNFTVRGRNGNSITAGNHGRVLMPGGIAGISINIS
jgi:hypothetical protein